MYSTLNQSNPNAQSALFFNLYFQLQLVGFLYAEVTGEDGDRGLLSERTNGGGAVVLSNISLLYIVRSIRLARYSASITDGIRAVMVYTGHL